MICGSQQETESAPVQSVVDGSALIDPLRVNVIHVSIHDAQIQGHVRTEVLIDAGSNIDPRPRKRGIIYLSCNGIFRAVLDKKRVAADPEQEVWLRHGWRWKAVFPINAETDKIDVSFQVAPSPIVVRDRSEERRVG